MGPVALPDDVYPELAPLPVPLAQHLYRYWTNKSSTENEQENLATFLAEIHEKRQYIYMYMDSFVRNEDDQSPHRLRYTTQWLRETLGPYTPNKQPIPSKTSTIGWRITSCATPGRGSQHRIREQHYASCA